MSKVRIYCPKHLRKKMIEAFHAAKAIDIMDHKRTDELDIGSPLEGTEEISDALVKARSLIYQLNLEKRKGNGFKTKEPELKKRIRDTKALYAKVMENSSEQKEIESRLAGLKDAKERLSAILKLGLPLELFHETENIRCFTGYVDDQKQLRAELERDIGEDFEVYSARHRQKEIVAVFAAKEKEIAALSSLGRHTFSEVKLPEEHIKSKRPLDDIEKEIKTLEDDKARIEADTKRLRQKSGREILTSERLLHEAAEKSSLPLRFAETTNIAIISGWVPENTKDRFIRSVEKATAGNIHIEVEAPSEEDDVPVKLDNPKPARSYEFLLRLFSIPSYHELDPSIFMFITFPLFFGFMLGDIGYGIVTLIAFLIFRKLIPEGRQLLNIMIFSSISTIIFGMIYGEFFGFELAHFHAIEAFFHNRHIHYPLLHRSGETVNELILITLIIGALHVNFGLALGFANVLRHHGLKHAILEKGSWFMLEIGVALLALSFTGIQGLLYPGIGVLVLAVVLLYKGEGVQGLVELPTIFVHIGSYMRLMAIGLASVSLAVVINQQTGPMFEKGIAWIVIAVFIFTLGHIINILLGVIGPFLHSLRLHYVEHFTKFYNGGGREFAPFGAQQE